MKQDSILTPLFKTIDKVVFGFQDLEDFEDPEDPEDLEDNEEIKSGGQNIDKDEEAAEEKVIIRSIN
ncbi:MAG: hypothetical protein WC627_03380 [Legionella sp.]|jgi:hypothetical protein